MREEAAQLTGRGINASTVPLWEPKGVEKHWDQATCSSWCPLAGSAVHSPVLAVGGRTWRPAHWVTSVPPKRGHAPTEAHRDAALLRALLQRQGPTCTGTGITVSPRTPWQCKRTMSPIVRWRVPPQHTFVIERVTRGRRSHPRAAQSHALLLRVGLPTSPRPLPPVGSHRPTHGENSAEEGHSGSHGHPTGMASGWEEGAALPSLPLVHHETPAPSRHRGASAAKRFSDRPRNTKLSLMLPRAEITVSYLLDARRPRRAGFNNSGAVGMGVNQFGGS